MCCDTDLNLFSPCYGCTINRNDHEPSSCSFSLLRSWSKVIPPSFITDFNRNMGIKTVHIDDLIAFSQQHNVPPNQSRHNLPYIILPTTVDEQLIRSQVSSNILASELVDIWIDNVSYLRLNNSNLPITAYTNGSLSSKHVRRDHSRPNNISMIRDDVTIRPY